MKIATFAPVNLFMVVSVAAVALFIYTGYKRNKKGGYQ